MGILVVLPIAAAIAILEKRRIEDFIFPAIGIIVIMIITAGFWGNTIPGVKAGLILGGISAVYCLIMLLLDRERFCESVFTPGLLAGGLYIIVTGILLIGKSDLGADNDTFWYYAPQVLNLYRYGELGNVGMRAQTFMLLYTAPIFTGWCYFCNKLWFAYSDGINLWARQIFIIAGLLPLFGVIKKGEGKKTLLMLFVVTLLPLMVVNSQSFMIDIPMGSVMVYGTITTMKLYRDRQRYNDAGYILGACVWLLLLSIMKRAGGIYTYGMVSVAVVYTVQRIRSKEDGAGFVRKILPLFFLCIAVACAMPFCIYRREYFDSNIFYFFFPVLGLLVYIGVGGFCAILLRMLEKKRYLLSVATLGMFFCGVSWAIRELAPFGRERFLEEEVGNTDEIFFKFFSWWFNGGRFENGWVISDFLYILMLFLLVLGARALISRRKEQDGVTVAEIDCTMIPVFIGYIVYMMFYCFIYMFQQGGYLVGGEIGWTDRYLGPPLMLTTAVVLYELLSIRFLDGRNLLIGALLLLLLVLPNNPFSILSLKSDNYMEKYAELFEKSGLEPQEEDRFFCVGPDHCQYYVFPAYGPIDYQANNAEYEPEELEAAIRSGGYKYILLEDYAWEFPDKYQSLFAGGKASIQKWAIYDAAFDAEGNMRLAKRGGL